MEELLVEGVDAFRHRRREQVGSFQEREIVTVSGCPHDGINLRVARGKGNKHTRAPLDLEDMGDGVVVVGGGRSRGVRVVWRSDPRANPDGSLIRVFLPNASVDRQLG